MAKPVYKTVVARGETLAIRSQKPRKCSSKKSTKQDFVSTSPNLDALRNDKEDAAPANIAIEVHKKNYKNTKIKRTRFLIWGTIYFGQC